MPLDLFEVECVVALIDVDHDGRAARLEDRLEARGEGRRGNDHPGSFCERRREQGEPQGVEPARETDAVWQPGVFREGLLELLHCVAVDEVSAVDGLGDMRERPLLDCAACRPEVDERHFESRWAYGGGRTHDLRL